jgi:hypothetical protein
VNTLNKIERLLGLGGEAGHEEELSGDLVRFCLDKNLSLLKTCTVTVVRTYQL